jgi:hypothetical protein
MKNHTIRDAYRFYRENGGTLGYEDYREVCSEFNLQAMDSVVDEGRTLEMGADLSYIRVKRVQRNFKKLSVDWKESHLLKQEILDRGGTPREAGSEEGENWLVFRTCPFYCMFHWHKKGCKVRHRHLYRFDPTRGQKGHKSRLVERLNNDPLAHLTYDTE